MATAIAPDDEDQSDPGQDDRETVVAPQIQVAPPVPVTAPNQAPIMPPSGSFQDRIDRVRAIGGTYSTDEAEQAVATAMKYQAIRGYQRDLQNGTPASDALAKWAPMMFSQPKAATLGQAASMVRASRPSEKYMDIGGVGYQMQGGKATPLTPPKVVKPKTVPLVLPADPDNPMTGGHVTVQLDPEDPLVKKTLERARTGPPAPVPEPPGIISRIKDAVFGNKSPQGSPPAAVPSAAPTPSPSPAPAALAPPSPVRSQRPTTPEEKLAAARALRATHPDWTKKQILEAVNQ